VGFLAARGVAHDRNSSSAIAGQFLALRSGVMSAFAQYPWAGLGDQLSGDQACPLDEESQRVRIEEEEVARGISSIEAVTLDAVRMRLRDVVDQLGAFEARHGRTFEQFAADWDAGRVADRFSHRIERDFKEWEALTMERQELLDLIRELSAPLDAAS